MGFQTIKDRRTNQTIVEGDFKSFRACAEDAVAFLYRHRRLFGGLMAARQNRFEKRTCVG